MKRVLCEASARFGGNQQTFELLPDDPRIDLFLGGIVGFEIVIEEIAGIARLAQDKGPEHARIASDFLTRRRTTSTLPLLQALLEETFGRD